MVTCAICGNSQYEPPEEHDMQQVSSNSDCWSTTVTYACSKCSMEQTMHGDRIYPEHAWGEFAAEGRTAYSCSQCGLGFTVFDEIGKFSYAEVLENFKIGDPGVKHEGFGFTSLEFWNTDRPIDIVTKAELELDYNRYEIKYDIVSVAFDKDSDTWCVDFYTEDLPGGGCSVYIDDSGCVCYMVFGE